MVAFFGFVAKIDEVGSRPLHMAYDCSLIKQENSALPRQVHLHDENGFAARQLGEP
jgi:hypothetical protein